MYFRGVDKIVAVEASKFVKFQQASTSDPQHFQGKRVRDNNFSTFQRGLESGSGPGGRWFKSTRPDHSFQKRYLGLLVFRSHRRGDNRGRPDLQDSTCRFRSRRCTGTSTILPGPRSVLIAPRDFQGEALRTVEKHLRPKVELPARTGESGSHGVQESPDSPTRITG